MGEKKEIEGKFVYPNNYRQDYINGAFGGRTAKGEMVVNFFFETLPCPEKSEIQVLPNGVISESIISQNDVTIKEVRNGIIMNLETAKSIYEWLGRNIAVEEEKNKNNKEGE